MTGGVFAPAVLTALERTGIPFMVTGSIAGAVHGAGRATMDLDLVVDPAPGQLERFVASLDPGAFYVSLEAAREAEANRTLFNVIDLANGWKVDLILRKDREFSRVEFARRTPTDLGGIVAPVATVEDVILSKLEWARVGESARQVEDAAALVRIHGDGLDRGYLDLWVGRLGLARQWDQATGLI